MVKITIDAREYEVIPSLTVLQACKYLSIEIPHFCYHDRLDIAGNCRMCLVELDKAPKLIASCAVQVTENMVIHTRSAKVIEARKGVMEFLLINHPLDCPICDQGGECDLQDQAVAYGMGLGRFNFPKRAIEEKNFGPLIKTHMTRCIHCMRCIRFLDDIAGVRDLGSIYRGEDMEIDTYIERGIKSELSGNIIDLCPVGALTSKPYAFTARPWELSHCETIDVLDATGSAIRIDTRGREIMRILPRVHEEINEEWLSDKARFSYDGLKKKRLDRPYLRTEGILRETTWQQALQAAADKLLTTKKIGAIAGDLSDCEAMFCLKELFNNLGSNAIECRQDNAKLSTKIRGHYLFNTTIADIEKADLCFLIGTNPRIEAPIINARIRKRYVESTVDKNFLIANLGPKIDLGYEYVSLGQDIHILEEIYNDQHSFAKQLTRAQHAMLILGQEVLTRTDGASILYLASKIAEKYQMIRNDWNGFNILHTSAARVGGLEIGFTQGDKLNIHDLLASDLDVLYLLNADDFDINAIDENVFVIYQGHHGDHSAYRADIILPGATYAEKDAIYVNTEGRAQYAYAAVSPPGLARIDWQIICDLARYVVKDLDYKNIEEIREKLAKQSPCFAHVNNIVPSKWQSLSKPKKYFLNASSIVLKQNNFYTANSISRASQIMTQCAAELL